MGPGEGPPFTPGDYLQVEIPTYAGHPARGAGHPRGRTGPTGSGTASSAHVATNARPGGGTTTRWPAIRRASATSGSTCAWPRPPRPGLPPGVGSTYMFRLRPGDEVTALGPFGDFHLKPTQREMVFIGGGAGMAPLRAQLSHLFETEGTQAHGELLVRRPLPAGDLLRGLLPGSRAPPPQLHGSASPSRPAPRGPLGGARSASSTRSSSASTCKAHPRPAAAEYYLCGPPRMIDACTAMLREFAVPDDQVAYDEF